MTARHGSGPLTRRAALRYAVAGLTAPALLSAFAEDVGHVILGFPAGAGLDPFARMVAEGLRGRYLPNLIVENRAGAAGQIAAESLRRAPKDGTYLLITPASPLVLAPHTQKNLPYDPVADFTPVTTLLNYQMGLQVGPGAPGVKTLAQYIEWVRKDPAHATYGTPGVGSMQHFLGTMFARAAGLPLQHVPYRGAPPMFQDLLSGQVPAVLAPVGGDSITRHKAGTVRMLAVASRTRLAVLPDVPTFVELGYPDLALSEWIGAFLPAATPAPNVEELRGALRVAMDSPGIAAWCALGGQERTFCTSAELRATIASDLQYWKRVVAETGFTAQG
jgi:tripartite-type tricarboxylate transporter receptor subunit TctC